MRISVYRDCLSVHTLRIHFPLTESRVNGKFASHAGSRFSFREVPHVRRASAVASLFKLRRRHDQRHLLTMGKRKAKKRSASTLKTTSYFKRFQVKFARRRAGASCSRHPR